MIYWLLAIIVVGVPAGIIFKKLWDLFMSDETNGHKALGTLHDIV